MAYSQEFERFFALWPLRIKKAYAFKSYEKAIAGGTSHDAILQGTIRYRQYLESPGWRPNAAHASTWLNQQRWEDDYGAAPAPVAIKAPRMTVPSEIAEKLRTVMDDASIKRWFEGASFGNQVITFKKKFTMEWVQRNYESKLQRAFGFMPELVSAEDFPQTGDLFDGLEKSQPAQKRSR